MIRSLTPKKVTDSLKDGKKGGVFESLYLTPGVFHYDDDKPKEKNYYYAYGFGIDLRYDYAQAFGLIPQEMRWFDHTFIHGHFLTVEQLWHALFNTPFTGEVNVLPDSSTEVSVVIKSSQMSETHQLVLESLQGERSKEEFLEQSEEVISGYRAFTVSDLRSFTFPEGYQPIAVAQEGNFAIAFKQLEKGVELCFQIPTEKIIDQIEDKQREIVTKIRVLEYEKEFLEEKRQKLLTNE